MLKERGRELLIVCCHSGFYMKTCTNYICLSLIDIHNLLYITFVVLYIFMTQIRLVRLK